MTRNLSVLSAALVMSGCVRPAALQRSARAVQRKVVPITRSFAEGSRRLVQYAGQTAVDATLTARLKAALAVRKGIDAGEIHLSVEEGVVRLSGQVSSAARKRAAAEVVRNTVGVTKVDNRLRVVPTANAAEG